MAAAYKARESSPAAGFASELASLFSKQVDLNGGSSPAPLPRIRDRATLDAELGSVCQSIFDALTSRQCEATYQRCLTLDLEESGLTVASEVPMYLTYKGQRVGTRRADLVVRTTDDAALSVLELKAVSALTSEHLKQIEFYMYYLSIDVGYLVNFPHDSGFPDVTSGGQGGVGGDSEAVFLQTVLAGSQPVLSDRATRGKHDSATVQIVKVVRQRSGAQFSRPIGIFGLTLKGLPCKVCLRQQGFCSQHEDQDTSGGP